MYNGYRVGVGPHDRVGEPQSHPATIVAQVRALKVEASHHRHLFSPDTDRIQNSDVRVSPIER